MLVVSGGARPLAGDRVLAPQQMQDGRTLKICGSVRLPLFVNQQRKSYAGLVTKGSRIGQIAQSNGGQACFLVRKRLLVIAQLRDVLTAENSPVMPKEDNYRRPTLPQRAQSDRVLLAVRQNDLREPRAK